MVILSETAGGGGGRGIRARGAFLETHRKIEESINEVF